MDNLLVVYPQSVHQTDESIPAIVDIEFDENNFFNLNLIWHFSLYWLLFLRELYEQQNNYCKTVMHDNFKLVTQRSNLPASSYLSHQPQPTAGGPPLLHQAVIPNISQPPPALPFPHHRLPPPHFLPQPGNALLLPQPPMRPMLPYGMPPTHRPPPPSKIARFFKLWIIDDKIKI